MVERHRKNLFRLRMKISIVIPVYNVEEYVVRCLDSVASQTYDGQIECLLVDDCGPDNSAQICKDYIEKYSGPITFKFIQREKNGGLSAARNTGIQVASGDYIYFLDSDDEIPSNSMELLANEVEIHSDVDVVMGFMLDDRKSEYYDISSFSDHQYTTDRYWIQYNTFKMGKNIPVNGCNKLIRRNYLLENNLFFKPGIIHEDNHWMFYLVQKVKGWAFVFEPTYVRYWNEGSIMTSSNIEKEALNWQKIILDFCNNFYSPFRRLQLSRYLYLYFIQDMFSFKFEGSQRLYFSFLNNCVKEKLYKIAILLLIWIFLHSFNRGIRIQNKLKQCIQEQFQKESGLSASLSSL